MTTSRAFLLSVLAFVVSSCGGINTQLTIESLGRYSPPSPSKKPAYGTFWESMENLSFDLAQLELDEEHQQFAKGLQAAVARDTSAAEAIFESLYRSAKDRKIREKSEDLLAGLYQSQSKWRDIVGLTGYLDRDETNIKVTFEALSKVPAESFALPTKTFAMPFSPSITSSPIIDVEINGHPRKFWLDTGASMSAIASDVAEECGVLPLTKQKSTGHSGTTIKVELQPGVVNHLKIGELHIKNHPVLIVDEADLEINWFIFPIAKIDGIIGWPVIQKVAMVLDFENEELTIQKPGLKRRKARNFTWLELPLVQLSSQDGSALNFYLDTGGFSTVLHNNFFRKIAVQGARAKETTIHSAGGAEVFNLWVVPQAVLLLGRYRLTFQDISTAPAPYEGFVKLDGRFGNDIAENGKLLIDYPNGLVEIFARGG